MDDELEKAIGLIESGHRAEGREHLIEILKANPKNDAAWGWMSTVVETDELRRECLQEALKHNPRNAAARQALERLDQKKKQPFDQPAPARTAAPRPSSVKVQSKNTRGIVFPIFAIVMAFIMIALGVLTLREEAAYRMEGQVTNGFVSDAKWLYKVNQGGDTCNVTYQFYANNASYQGYSEFPCTEWDKVTSTRRMQVEYLASNPKKSRFYPNTTNFMWLSICVFGFAGFFLLFGLFQLISRYSSRNT
jgi:hypothetical protein